MQITQGEGTLACIGFRVQRVNNDVLGKVNLSTCLLINCRLVTKVISLLLLLFTMKHKFVLMGFARF